eukprot:5936886-Pleurochrysis_carterae.AAC.2
MEVEASPMLSRPFDSLTVGETTAEAKAPIRPPCRSRTRTSELEPIQPSEQPSSPAFPKQSSPRSPSLRQAAKQGNRRTLSPIVKRGPTGGAVHRRTGTKSQLSPILKPKGASPMTRRASSLAALSSSDEFASLESLPTALPKLKLRHESHLNAARALPYALPIMTGPTSPSTIAKAIDQINATSFVEANSVAALQARAAKAKLPALVHASSSSIVTSLLNPLAPGPPLHKAASALGGGDQAYLGD